MAEDTSIRCRPYYNVEQAVAGVELLAGGQRIGILSVENATALGCELIRMGAMAESEAHVDLGYVLLGRTLEQRNLLQGMIHSARNHYYGETTEAPSAEER